MKRKIKVVFACMILLAVVVYLVFGFDKAVDEYASYGIVNKINLGIYDICRDKVTDNEQGLASAVELTRDADGNVISLTVDAAFLNRLASEILAESVMFVEESCLSFRIPFGNITTFRFLSGTGPKIRIKTIPLGNISGGIVSSFEDAGINQTIYRVRIEIKGVVEALTPIRAYQKEISVSFVISETVIIGKVPQVYVR